MLDKKALRDDFEQVCQLFAQKRGISQLPEKFIWRCIEIPEEGFNVLYARGEVKRYFPLISPAVDDASIKKIGTFSVEAGICIFVYVDGKTYLTKNREVIQALQDSGYEKRDYDVPLSQRGKIKDNEDFAQLWAKLRR